MILVFSALTPVFLMFMFGYILKNGDLIFDSFWPPAEKTTFYFFPSLLLANTAKAELADISVTPVIIATTSHILIIAAIT
jgi:predicted permease